MKLNTKRRIWTGVFVVLFLFLLFLTSLLIDPDLFEKTVWFLLGLLVFAVILLFLPTDTRPKLRKW